MFLFVKILHYYSLVKIVLREINFQLIENLQPQKNVQYIQGVGIIIFIYVACFLFPYCEIVFLKFFRCYCHKGQTINCISNT